LASPRKKEESVALCRRAVLWAEEEDMATVAGGQAITEAMATERAYDTKQRLKQVTNCYPAARRRPNAWSGNSIDTDRHDLCHFSRSTMSMRHSPRHQVCRRLQSLDLLAAILFLLALAVRFRAARLHVCAVLDCSFPI
jgi:hypothetical protein